MHTPRLLAGIVGAFPTFAEAYEQPLRVLVSKLP